MAESAGRKLCEEAGVQGTAAKLLGVLDLRLLRSYAKHRIHHNVLWVELCGNHTSVAGPETTGLGFFCGDALPDLSPSQELCVPVIFKLVRGDLLVPSFGPLIDSARRKKLTGVSSLDKEAEHRRWAADLANFLSSLTPFREGNASLHRGHTVFGLLDDWFNSSLAISNLGPGSCYK